MKNTISDIKIEVKWVKIRDSGGGNNKHNCV